MNRIVQGVLAVAVAAAAALAGTAGPASATPVRPAAVTPAATPVATFAGYPNGAAGVNDPDCRSTAHPDPVVVLHGLGATYYEDLNLLQADLAQRGYCTFSLTYGAYPSFPLVGGLRSVTESAPMIKAFILDVLSRTGASKVSIVGHSEGGFQSLYVPKTQGIADKISRVVAIAPPTHGTSFAHLWTLAQTLGIDGGVRTALGTLGCPACGEITTGGSAVTTLEAGPIAQPGVAYTVITSRYDELVTPTSTSFVREPGVTNQYVQDFCPLDPVGHIGEAYDTNVWNMTANALDPQHAKRFICTVCSPG